MGPLLAEGEDAAFISLPSCHAARWCLGSKRWQSLLPVHPKARYLACPSLNCQVAERASVIAPHGSHAMDQDSSLGILKQIQKDQAWPFPGHTVQAAPSSVWTAFSAPRDCSDHSSGIVAAAGEVRSCSSDCCWLQLWLAPPHVVSRGCSSYSTGQLVSVLSVSSVGAAVREGGVTLGSQSGYVDGKGAVPEWHQCDS